MAADLEAERREWLERELAEAPPMTAEQRRVIADLFASSDTDDETKAS
jgi:hypothetical protein